MYIARVVVIAAARFFDELPLALIVRECCTGLSNIVEIASCHRLLVRPIDAAITESDSKQSSEKLLICTKLDGPFQQARVLWTGMLRPSLSQNWIARKFEKAKTIAASYRTTSCHARLDHLHDVRRCLLHSTYTRSVCIHPAPRDRWLSPL